MPPNPEPMPVWLVEIKIEKWHAEKDCFDEAAAQDYKQWAKSWALNQLTHQREQRDG